LVELDNMREVFKLYRRIIVASLITVFISLCLLSILVSSNIYLFLLLALFYLGFFWVIGFILFLIIWKTRLKKFVNKKSVNIFSAILILLGIAVAIFLYYHIVPPKEVTNSWKCNEGQEICNKIDGIRIIYDTTYMRKEGSFVVEKPQTSEDFDLLDIEFRWEYDESSGELTIEEERLGWIKLRLDIDESKEPHYTMNTYYVDSSPGFPFDAKFFDGAEWTGLWDFNDQGR